MLLAIHPSIIHRPNFNAPPQRPIGRRDRHAGLGFARCRLTTPLKRAEMPAARALVRRAAHGEHLDSVEPVPRSTVQVCLGVRKKIDGLPARRQWRISTGRNRCGGTQPTAPSSRCRWCVSHWRFLQEETKRATDSTPPSRSPPPILHRITERTSYLEIADDDGLIQTSISSTFPP